MASTIIETKSYWLKQIKNYKTSGLPSKSVYCREAGVSYHRFIYWSEKLGKELAKENFATKPKEFIPVKLTPKSAPSTTAPLYILELRQGHRLLIQSESVERYVTPEEFAEFATLQKS